MTRPSVLESSLNFSKMTNYNANTNNVSQLQAALKALEDRCQKLQRRTDTLQTENERLLAGRSELLSEVERLQEQQIRLRERNLRLTQEFHAKQQECSLLAEKLTMFARGRVHAGNRTTGRNALVDLKEDAEASVDSLDNLADNFTKANANPQNRREPMVLSKTKRTLSEPNLSVIQWELDRVRKGLWTKNDSNEDGVEKISSELLTNLKKEQNELEEQFSRIVDVQRNSLEIVQELSSTTALIEEKDPDMEIDQCVKSSQLAVQKLLAQQTILKRLHEYVQNKAGKQKISESDTQTSLRISESSWTDSEPSRTCPLCEVNFPSTISQENFEDHVMEHFSNDDCILPDFEILT